LRTVFERSKLVYDGPSPYCPGCGHGIVHSLMLSALEETGMSDNAVLMAPVGCAILSFTWLDLDVCQPAHGRTPAAATGLKRVRPDSLVILYQGDGDLAAIGTAEIIHAANRGEYLTCIFVNNATYGMTGGQMAPTTLLGQKSTTCVQGRQPSNGMGWPLHVCELLQSLPGVNYLARTSVYDAANAIKTQRAIKKGFQCQLEKKGFSLIEVLAMCPVNWKKSPEESQAFIANEMTACFPLGEFKVDGQIVPGPQKKE
jgi:2-oxoglutarate ferredoxin oxidoreductase subunit beta